MIEAASGHDRQALAAPFPWFGGKSRAASAVWERFGELDSYVEPFFGSGAVLLKRPRVSGREVVNDADGFITNFWRAVQSNPDAVATGAVCPVNEVDLTARHLWLNNQREALTRALLGDPYYFNIEIAAWWLWGICSWIGDGWCAEDDGPWTTLDCNFTYDKRRALPGAHVRKKRPELGRSRGIHCAGVDVEEWMYALCDRLQSVRICCGDWSRVVTPAAAQARTWHIVGVFLDPPYASERYSGLYAVDSAKVAEDVNLWCKYGAPSDWKVCVAGLGGEHDNLGWERVEWRTKGGYGNLGSGLGRSNSSREVLWFSPACFS